MVDFTVAIPTFNGETRLPDVLVRLRSQVETESFSWEILVIDNNSSDRTAQVIREYQANWPSSYPLIYYFCPEQGAAFARQKAVEKARGKLIGFLDDDNLPEKNWVAAAYAFGQNHPQVGAYGSQIHGYFFEANNGEELPKNFQEIACFLAIVERGNTPHLYNPSHKILPPGAGLVVRKDVWLKNVPNRLFLNHQGKEAGMASEDLEALLHIQKAGWEIWYNPEMIVYHKIPNNRLKADYLRLLTRCVGLSRHRLRMMTLESWQRPLAFPAYLANDLRRLVLHLIKHGLKLKKDPVAACQREFLVSTLVSPLFLWKKKQTKKIPRELFSQSLQKPEEILNQIAQGFEQDRFCLYSQEIQPISTFNYLSQHREILLRLKDERERILPPSEFMPIAKYYNLMPTIDRWVVRQIFRGIAGESPDPSLSLYEINLSIETVKDPQFIKFLHREFREYEITPGMISFAISENCAIANLETVIQFIDSIKKIGSQVTLDNVGREKRSAEYLKKLPVDYLKINGKFFRQQGKNPRSLEKIYQINDLGHQLGMKTIAEAVENQEIFEQMKSVGVNYVQGYGIAPAHPLITYSHRQSLLS
jgi:EAL domain-containing protein (putative c-di-GMP-specific phosphodiesterase class I)/GT2 family glycosyltransferase